VLACVRLPGQKHSSVQAMEEVAPKAVGRERHLEKKAERRMEARARDVSPGLCVRPFFCLCLLCYQFGFLPQMSTRR
jgi:hypothetical protein